jgi:hypothetical protein
MESAAEDALFVFEVPGFDNLINRMRFDQVFHQHLQYFSISSFLRLLQEVGASYLLHRENYHDWGAVAVAFTRASPAKVVQDVTPRPTLNGIHDRYKLFRNQMQATTDMLKAFAGSTVYGYGAAQMLPVLGYHMATDFGQLTAVLDDDPEKEGIRYWNLPVKIIPSSKALDIAESSVFITAVDNVQPIMTKLLANRPRHIFFPLHII